MRTRIMNKGKPDCVFFKSYSTTGCIALIEYTCKKNKTCKFFKSCTEYKLSRNNGFCVRKDQDD